MEVDDYFKKGKISIWKENFAVVKSKKHFPEAFANIEDKNEITVIIDQSKIDSNESIIDIEKDWKLITFDMVLPFGLVGFLSKISKALTDENISIFAISAFSTDHILIKEKDLNKAINKLKSLGLTVNQ